MKRRVFNFAAGVALCALAAGRASQTATPAKTGSSASGLQGGSPHAEALRLVLQRCGDEINALDAAIAGPAQPGDAAWWFDTKWRDLSVKRPFGPGIFDSTHWFVVEYRVDGKVVASWSIDTRAGEVRRSEPE